MARHYGLKAKSITLRLFGGVSELGGDVPRPSAEAWIARVGPLTSLLLGGVFIGLAALAGASHPARASISGVIYFALVYLGATNVLLAAFNVIPAAPLDGAFFLTRDLSWVWTSLIGWFIAGSATAEAHQAVLASLLRGIRASQVMTPDPVTVPRSMDGQRVRRRLPVPRATRVSRSPGTARTP